MTELYGRPTAAELVAAVADFLDTDVRAVYIGVEPGASSAIPT